MNNATRFINSWLISADDSELRVLILNEFAPFVSYMVKSHKFPGIKVIAFTDNSTIINNENNYIITATNTEFIEAFLSIFRGNSHTVKRFFDECVSIIDEGRSENGITLTPAEHIKMDFNIMEYANEN